MASTDKFVRLPYRRPFDWQKLLAFFAARATPGVESVSAGAYRRSLRAGKNHVVIEIRDEPDEGALVLRCLGRQGEPPRAIVATARNVFDVDAPLDDIADVLGSDPALKPLLGKNAGVRVPGAWDGFELTVRAILGQQISVRAATTIAGRIAARYGERIEPAGDDLPDRLFPTPARLGRAHMNGLGIVGNRIRTIRTVARAVDSGALCFNGSQDPAEIRRALLAIPGIGDWTVGYVAMRALRDANAFPASDLGLRMALAPPGRVTARELAGRAERWRPWRAYAAMLLWGSLDGSGG